MLVLLEHAFLVQLIRGFALFSLLVPLVQRVERAVPLLALGIFCLSQPKGSARFKSLPLFYNILKLFALERPVERSRSPHRLHPMRAFHFDRAHAADLHALFRIRY